MDSKKTIIQGDLKQVNEENPFYRRSSTSNAGKTYIPDVFLNREGGTPAPESKRVERMLRLQDRVVAGVMFSVSRTPQGEIFPIYLGRNTIGSDPECDICLDEETVSPRHATLAVRRIQTDNGVVFSASITDYDSQYGTRVGDVALDYDKVDLGEEQMIGIGKHYQLLVHLFDTVKRGMFADDDFQLIDRPEPELPKYGATPVQPDDSDKYANTIGAGDEANFYGRSPKKAKDADARRHTC